MVIIVTHAYAQDAFIEKFGGERIITELCAISSIQLDPTTKETKIIHNRHPAWMESTHEN